MPRHGASRRRALSDEHRARGARRFEALVDLALPIVAALDLAHDEGILHRDLKPSNIFIARRWNGEVTPKLLDFGISKSSASRLNRAHHGHRVHRHAALRVARGDPRRGLRRRRARRSIFVRSRALRSVHRAEAVHGSGLEPPLARARDRVGPHEEAARDQPEIPEAFERVVRRAMAVLPEDRYASMQALGAALLFPLASERVRVIWEPVFGNSDPLESTAARTSASRHRASCASPVARAIAAVAGDRADAPRHAAWRAGRDRRDAAEHADAAQRSERRRAGRGDAHATPPSGVHAMPPPAESPNRFALPAALVGAFALLAMGFVAVKVAKAPQPAPAASAALASQRDVRASLRQVNPAGATIQIDGTPVGTGFITRSFARDGKRHTLRAFAAGHEPASLEFDETTPPPPLLTLRAGEEPLAHPSAATPSKPTPPGYVGRPGTSRRRVRARAPTTSIPGK